MNRKLGILDVKQALYDVKFQALFPELKEDIEKAIKDPTCACNRSIYVKFFKYKDRLKTYFPNREVETQEEETERLVSTPWLGVKVISCHINDLEAKLRKLPGTQKQIAIARWEDQVTVILNDLGFVL